MKLLRDGKGQVKGRINETSDGETIFDKNGMYRGRYIESSDKTFDEKGHIFGSGNQLPGLLNDY